MKKTILKRNGEPYLIRYTLFKCKWFTIKIHHVLISDPAELHDHPWNYISFILWGGYYEETKRVSNYPECYKDKINTAYYRNIQWYPPLSILIRNGSQPHRLILPEGKQSISLIFTSKKWRKWGYVNS